MSDLTERLRAAADGWEWKRTQAMVPLLLREAADALDAQDGHRQIDTPNWATKIRCACGYESVSRCEWALHAIKEIQR